MTRQQAYRVAGDINAGRRPVAGLARPYANVDFKIVDTRGDLLARDNRRYFVSVHTAEPFSRPDWEFVGIIWEPEQAPQR